MINDYKHLNILIAFICLTLNSCNTINKNILNKETLFVVFDNSNFEKKTIDNNPKSILNGSYLFLIYDNHKANYLTGSINLESKKFKDFDEMDRNNSTITFKVNKSFMKKNKDILVRIDDMQQMGFNKTFNLFKNAKHVFLLDKSEINNNKITIKEVYFNYVGEE